jgi:hypothetical protein
MITATSTTCGTVGHCWLRAWERARAEQLIPYRDTPITWSVKHYTVTVTGAGWSDLICSCPAGRSHKICKHMAVVAKAISVHVRPIRGTAKRQEPASSAASLWRVGAASCTSRRGTDMEHRHAPGPLSGPLT